MLYWFFLNKKVLVKINRIYSLQTKTTSFVSRFLFVRFQSKRKILKMFFPKPINQLLCSSDVENQFKRVFLFSFSFSKERKHTMAEWYFHNKTWNQHFLHIWHTFLHFNSFWKYIFLSKILFWLPFFIL